MSCFTQGIMETAATRHTDRLPREYTQINHTLPAINTAHTKRILHQTNKTHERQGPSRDTEHKTIASPTESSTQRMDGQSQLIAQYRVSVVRRAQLLKHRWRRRRQITCRFLHLICICILSHMPPAVTMHLMINIIHIIRDVIYTLFLVKFHKTTSARRNCISILVSESNLRCLLHRIGSVVKLAMQLARVEVSNECLEQLRIPVT